MSLPLRPVSDLLQHCAWVGPCKGVCSCASSLLSGEGGSAGIRRETCLALLKRKVKIYSSLLSGNSSASCGTFGGMNAGLALSERFLCSLLEGLGERALEAFPGMTVFLFHSERAFLILGSERLPGQGSVARKKPVFLRHCLAECRRAGTNKEVLRSLV